MKHEFKSIVAETLLIPLYMRAKESRRDNPILYDKAAERLADSLEYDYSQFDGAKLSEVGCVVRGCISTVPCGGLSKRIPIRSWSMLVADWTPVSSVLVTGKRSFMIWTCRRSSLCAESDTRTTGKRLYRGILTGN